MGLHKNTGMPGKRTPDGRDTKLNSQHRPTPRITDESEVDEDLTDRHARAFTRDVRKRSQGVKKNRTKNAPAPSAGQQPGPFWKRESGNTAGSGRKSD